MCGIAGMAAVQRADPDLVRAMAKLLSHRGPDDEGFVAIRGETAVPFAGDDTPDGSRGAAAPFLPRGDDPGRGPWDVVLASRRLAILDLSPRGHQPLRTERDPRAWIVHNGEIYNYLELRRELEARGHVFVGDSDTEVALSAYLEWGRACFERFNGMWGMAIWDGRANELVLSRDRFGVKPLYYAEAPGDIFTFASEIKALVATGAAPADADEASLHAFLLTGRVDVSGTATCFARVRQVEPGTYVVVGRDGPNATRYYDIESRLAATREQTLEELLADAVALRLRSDVPVGSSLSGGIDSSTVVALAQRRLGRGARMQTFTYGSHRSDDERAFARRAAEHVGADNVAVGTQDDDLPALLERLIWEQDEPIGSGSVLAQRAVMEAAHEHGLKVLLDGQGGDEVLAGYTYYVGAALADALARGRALRWATELCRGRRPPVQSARWLLRASVAGLRLRTHPLSRLQAMQLDDVHHHLPALLHYEDRNSMTFSIETRLPFLDYRVVELGLSLSNDAKIADGWTKLALRRAAEPLLPTDLVWRRDKVQFAAPQDDWLRGSLRDVVGDTIGITPDRSAVETWRRLVVALWREVFARTPAVPAPAAR